MDSRKTVAGIMVVFSLLAAVIMQTGCDRRGGKTYAVGIINPSPGMEEVVRGFRDGMQKHGYIEGKNITYLYDGPISNIDDMDDRIRNMLSKRPDLVYSLTTPATKKLKAALEGTGIPGIFGPVHDPVVSGIVRSLASPGGQLTGLKVRGSTPKALDWLRQIVPDLKHIYVPFHMADDAACQTVEDLQATASKLGIRITTEVVSGAADLDRVLSKIPSDADALWMTCSHLLQSNVDRIVKAAAERRLPTASSTHSPYRHGILMSYGENDFSLGVSASRLADKILKGASPEQIPVETAEFFLGLNLKTAGSIGLEVPAGVIKQADFVVR